MTTIAISVPRVLENVYALCALDYFTSKEPRPDVLGREQAPTLKSLVRRAACELIFRLMPYAVDTDLDIEKDEDIFTIDFELPSGQKESALRRYLEDALAASVMAIARSGNDTALSDAYRQAFDKALDGLLARLRAADKPGRIAAA